MLDAPSIKLESMFTSIENINLLTFDDIMEIRDRALSRNADEFFSMINGEVEPPSVERSKDIVAAYLHGIESRLAGMTASRNRDRSQNILISATRFTNTILIRVKNFLIANKSYSSVATAGASAMTGFPIPIDIVLDLAGKGAARSLTVLENDIKTQLKGELVTFSQSRDSLLKIRK